LQDNNVHAKDRKLVVDKVAAAVMLQSWLDAQKKSSNNG
jgi:RNase H-fold protein (predicted Holliday junction resolvase)